ncbi:Uu.00g075520.m01.CDS01 [Anthostomella pinea]|uniref:tRNA (adenine(58)-N(1))-methyltransferase non-catalytic subunit TRM6 n=1 Tax=Anthostomella pinea TaxID=933095 RepID=A0AAI8YLR5_9PEZI|nr:Uu.00g075520.m01.CDS01 [Anthostomella pinea]
MHSLVEPNAWVALKMPAGNLRVLEIAPNTTISLGKYGSFPSNLIIHRPYHLTYELQDKQAPETFNRLRIVPASELYSDILSSGEVSSSTGEATPVSEDAENAVPTGIEYSLVDPDSGAVVATTNRAELDASARQTLTMEEIEELKKDGTDSGKDLIAKLMLSHTAIEQKTQYSLAKYKLLKTKKYIRRFSVLPLDVALLDHWLVEEKDPTRVMDMREEMIGLLGCWANVHFGGEERCKTDVLTTGGQDEVEQEHGQDQEEQEPEQSTGRWLVVDDTGGLLVAAMAERMGVLYQSEKDKAIEAQRKARLSKQRPHEPGSQPTAATDGQSDPAIKPAVGQVESEIKVEIEDQDPTRPQSPETNKKQYNGEGRQRWNDLHVPFSQTNTLTLIHANSQPNLSTLRYYDFDITNPSQGQTHPLAKHLMTLSWLQLLEPQLDSTYNSELPTATPDELKTWKGTKRGTYHRKRRRWAKVRHTIDSTRQGEFSGLVVASSMDPVSIMRHTVPLLAGGAPIAIYSPSVEPLTKLADCYSVARRAAWVAHPPEEAIGKSIEELEQWAGTDEFPLNPSLVLGASIQTSRVRKWQVLPGRTHPVMTSRGGAEGYVFTAWRVKPAEGKVEARGKARPKKRKAEEVDQVGQDGTGS